MKRVWSLLLALVMMATTLCVSSSAATTRYYGDIDGDGTLTTADARDVLRYTINNVTLTAEQLLLADYTEDGTVDTADAREILRASLSGAAVKPYEPASTAVRSFWIPYMEVEELLVSLDPAACRKAIDTCLDDCVSRGANTIYFHVRSNSDAYYDSSVYPANYKTSVLLGKGFDPLACAVELAHEKGLKIEAWVNPYRIGTDTSRIMVDATFTYQNRYYYVPSNDDVQDLVVSGVRELVENYDIDGVQFDDYFYPEGAVSATAAASFEQTDYAAYQAAGGTLSVSDWRRNEVSALVAACYEVCHSREGCVFGISPACDYENTYSAMYADIPRWAATPGFLDYLAPQLYVGFEHQYMPFEQSLAAWDAMERHDGVTMVAGLALYKTGATDTWAGSGANEWLENDDILAREIASTYAIGWDGIGLYSHQYVTVGTDRDTAIGTAEVASACEAWLVFE